jgi:hypothetical protein
MLAVFLVSGACLVPPTYAPLSSRPVISSEWTSRPPVIDGRFVAGEWSNLQIAIQGPGYPDSYVKPTFVYFMNDNIRLYVLVDAPGDTHNDGFDECLLVFGFEHRVSVEIIGTEFHGAFDATAGFDSSPNDPTFHKIYEFSIPFSLIDAELGQPIDFSSPLVGKHFSMPYDSYNGHDNVWPVGLNEENFDNVEAWGTLRIGDPASPVGGFVEPVNKLSMIAPYLALFGTVAAVAVVVVARKKSLRPENFRFVLILDSEESATCRWGIPPPHRSVVFSDCV